jgi:DNA-binding IclR family transcriptional regulator
MDTEPAPISQSLIHGFRVLQAFTASEPALTLGQVASRAGLDNGTAFHLVQTLVMLGYVERIAGSKQFRLTLKPLELGFHAIVQNPESFLSMGIDSRSRYRNTCSLSELLENVCSLTERPAKPK